LRKKQQLIVTAVAVAAIIIITVAYLVFPTSQMQIGGEASAIDQTERGEYIKLDVKVGSWTPRIFYLPQRTTACYIKSGFIVFSPFQTTNEFWAVDGNKKTSVSASITISLDYKGIKPYSLNVSICKFWFECSQQALLIDTSENGINGANEEGTVTKTYSSGTVALDGSTSDPFVKCGCAQDGNTYTIYGKFQVTVEGMGAVSGDKLTADTGIQNTNPASWQVQWYGEEVQSGTIEVGVQFSSWIDVTPIIAAAVIFIAVIIVVGRRRRGRLW